MFRVLAVSVIVVALHAPARAQQAPEPSGPHPRILLDESLRAAWKAQAKQKDTAVARAIARCEDTRANPKEYKRDSYMGFDWSASLNACLISYVVRGADEDAQSAVQFVKALLDDQEYIGDGKGGEKTVRRDTGYAIRSVPPYVAIAYDWLHDHKAMTPLQEKIRERFAQWLGWYKASGYHNHSPATNYHAGYVLAATLVAIAQGGEAGAFNTELWNHVRDDVWGKDMAKALAPNGRFDGGDFPEGWQYAPLSVAEYALTARIGAPHGLKIDGVDKWLTAMFVRNVHARSGGLDTIAAIGDVEAKTPSIPMHAMTLLAILIGPAPEITHRQARYELDRLGLRAKDNPLAGFYEAIAETRAVTPAGPVLEKWPTSYYAAGISAFYARTTWAKQGVWLATICPPQYDADHLAPSAGNLVITRGVDEALVDPSPYGSLSSLTSNAPTVDSPQQLDKYRPSQAPWGETTHFAWALQTATGVVATRCDYADQYKFQERPSDIPLALRDIVLIPWGKERADASTVVIDRAETGAADRLMYLRFRSPAMFALEGERAQTKVGSTTFTVRRVVPAAARPEVRAPKVDACWDMGERKCDMARFPVGEYRVTVAGPAMEAIHVLDTAATDDLTVATIGDGVTHLRRGTQDAYVAARPVAYTTKPSAGAIHVVLTDSASAKLAVTRDGDKCKIDVGSDGPPREPAPFVFLVDDKCQSTDDARTGPAAPDLAGSAAGTLITVGGVPKRRKNRGGCCDAGGGGAGSIVLAVFVVGALRRRRPR